LQQRVWCGRQTLASGEGQPPVPDHRTGARVSAWAAPALSATPAGAADNASWSRVAARGSAPRMPGPEFGRTVVRSAGVLCQVLGGVRSGVPTFLQRGVPLGVTARGGSGSGLSPASAPLAAWAN